jgi:hypothetical protein
METGALQFIAVETAVAIPSEIFQQAEDMARTLGLTRNEAYAEALAEWMKRKRDAANKQYQPMTPAEEEEFIRQLNEVYDRVDTSLDPFVMQLQLTSLDPEKW